ncbi:MAG: aminopeptidase [Longimicrobiales bacterium]
MRRRSVFSLLAVAAIAAASLTCSPVYVLRAGYEEAKILSRRRPIPEVIEDAGTHDVTRDKLRLVMKARDYAARVLDLDAGDSFTTYSWVDSDTLLLVLSAARKDAFEPYTWWFPIVGRVPYKGFFDFDEAHEQARRLDERGYDTHVRPSAAFSTLGWFNDPVLNTVLRYGDVDLAQTVIHELTHNTIYISGQAGFNESFATFVGDRGAAAFFCDLEGPDGERCRLATDAWHDTMRFGAFLQALVDRLEALYAQELPLDTVLARRSDLYRAAQEEWQREHVPQLRTGAFARYFDRPLNNAVLIGSRLYYQRLDLFEAVYQRYGGDLRRAARAIEEAARSREDDPFAAVEDLLAAPQRP